MLPVAAVVLVASRCLEQRTTNLAEGGEEGLSDVRVKDIGEFQLIGLLTQALPAEVRGDAELVLGSGDDAAIWQPAAGEQVIVTTDSLIEDIHFRTEWTDWESLGHKSLAVNLSDLAAMGGEPRL